MPRQPSRTLCKHGYSPTKYGPGEESALYMDSNILSHAAGAELSPELQEAKEAGKGRPFFNLPAAQTASQQSPPGQGNFSF